jgi:ABC-2 type transport system permease protein
MFSVQRLLAIARKETIQLRRDRRSLLLAFLLPLLLLVFFGYAITLDVRDIRLAVLDQDRSSRSRELVDAMVASGYFRISHDLEHYRDAGAVLAAGDATAVLTIPPRFGSSLDGGQRPALQLLVDGSDANTATIALGYADAIVASWGARIMPYRDGVSPPVTAESRVWYNPELRSRNQMVPALIAVIMSIIAALLTALTIAREWERGTMEQLIATPVGRAEVVLGKLIPYAVIGLIDVTITAVAGMLIFGVPLRGSVPLLAVLTVLFLCGALGLGLFISAALRSQMLATQAAIVATYLPAVLLSGYIFDIGSMPAFVRGITYLVPARYFVEVTRGIFLKDVGLAVLWPEALAMVLFASVGLGLATFAFRKQVAR